MQFKNTHHKTKDQKHALRTCPFCGGKAELHGEGSMYQVRCTNRHCQCKIAIWHDEPEDAVQAWNTRATNV